MEDPGHRNDNMPITNQNDTRYSSTPKYERAFNEFNDLKLVKGIKNQQIITSEDVITWMFDIEGPPDSPYKGYDFKLKILFSIEYPHKVPVFENVTPLWNPFIPANPGTCSFFVSKEFLGKDWNIYHEIKHILEKINGEVLTNPCAFVEKFKLSDWPNKEAKDQTKSAFCAQAAEWAKSHGIKPVVGEWNQLHGNKEVAINDMSNVLDVYDKAYEGLPQCLLDFKPCEGKSCETYIQDIDKDQGTDFIYVYRKCFDEINNRRSELKNDTLLKMNELIAILMYTTELQNQVQHINFYYKLNKMLQERKIEIIKIWAGYLHFFTTGLEKIRNNQTRSKTVAYRGVIISNIDDFSRQYILGRRIHWSGFTSTTEDINKAKSFISGKGGIIMKITVVCGIRLGQYSMFPSELEILLFANSAFLVQKELYKEGDYFCVDLLQEHPGATLIK